MLLAAIFGFAPSWAMIVGQRQLQLSAFFRGFLLEFRLNVHTLILSDVIESNGISMRIILLRSYTKNCDIFHFLIDFGSFIARWSLVLDPLEDVMG